MFLDPVGTKVIVKQRTAEEVTKGGIFLPEKARERQQEGEVLAVGDGVLLRDGTYKALKTRVGDRVLFSNYGGTEILWNGSPVLIVEESQIYAIIREGDPPSKLPGVKASSRAVGKRAVRP